MAWPLASTLLALSACNALTGVTDLSQCPTCEEAPGVDAGVAFDAKVTETSVLDGSSPDARDGATTTDASKDADAEAGGPIGCQGATACVRIMFATSVGYTGNLGGIAGADAKCQALADASILAQVKGRTFLAWVSTTATPVAVRMSHGTLPYLRTDGITIASSFNDLTDNSSHRFEKKVTSEWVVPEHVAHDHHQAVGALAAVDRLRRDEDPHAGRQAQHADRDGSSASTRRRTVSPSIDSLTRSTTPDRKTTSTRSGTAGRSSTNAGRAARATTSREGDASSLRRQM